IVSQISSTRRIRSGMLSFFACSVNSLCMAGIIPKQWLTTNDRAINSLRRMPDDSDKAWQSRSSGGDLNFPRVEITDCPSSQPANCPGWNGSMAKPIPKAIELQPELSASPNTRDSLRFGDFQL